jgi:hypothetical protein
MRTRDFAVCLCVRGTLVIFTWGVLAIRWLS